MHGFQIWVNLPAKDKMMSPRYQDIMSEELPIAESEDKSVWAKVIAGKALGAEAVIDTVIPITYIHMCLKPEAKYIHECEKEHNVMVYVFGGSVNIGGKTVSDGELGLCGKGDLIAFEAGHEGAEYLILGGPEIDEPIARYGPFVMNTREEIMQAITDFNNGTLA